MGELQRAAAAWAAQLQQPNAYTYPEAVESLGRYAVMYSNRLRNLARAERAARRR
jgi:hypothetical protein